MSVTYIGQTDFIPVSAFVVHTPDWGVQDATQRWRGAAIRLATFLASLHKGMASTETGFTQFKLNTWAQDDDNIYPTVTLNYLNSNPSKFPSDKSETNWSTQTAQKTADSGGDFTDIRRDVTFFGPTRTWSYYTDGEQASPRYSTSGTSGVTIIRQSIDATDADGNTATYYDNAPTPVANAVDMTEGDRTVSHSSNPVGAPECGIWLNEDVIARVLE